MSAIELVSQMKVKSKSGTGPCPVCHRARSETGCSTWWDVELAGERKWKGTLYVQCRGLPDREELAEGLNRYHQRDEARP